MRNVVKLSSLTHEEAHMFPRSARHALTEPVPKYELPAGGMDADTAYELIHGELLLDDAPALRCDQGSREERCDGLTIRRVPNRH